LKSNEGYFGSLFRHGDFLKFENITRIYSSFSVGMLSLVTHLDQWRARENITKIKKKLLNHKETRMVMDGGDCYELQMTNSELRGTDYVQRQVK